MRRIGIFLGGFPVVPAGLATGFLLVEWLNDGSIIPFIIIMLVDIICLYCLIHRADWIAEFKEGV